ncbi:MAG TPA: hypothetical protein VGK78_14720 [Nocardioides sp.]|uniref:hypothetical protein n=1 Tax=Nocardioides sp. TaxID=35761 RepID=UPI002F41CA24
MRLQGGEYRLTDLCDRQGKIVALDAEGVTFKGPAVILVTGQSTVANCKWDHGGGGIEAVVWEIDPVRTHVVGAIHVVDSSFVGCMFTNVGFAGPAELVNKFFYGTTPDPSAPQ